MLIKIILTKNLIKNGEKIINELKNIIHKLYV